MTQKRIHIVSFDVPFSPDYGGILDVFLRAKALKNAGYFIVMHCFDYGRGQSFDFSEVADEVLYYKRNSSPFLLASGKPYIVQSRANKQLLEDLLKDDNPILLEGQHCTAFTKELKHAGRKFAIRMHNVEWQYYAELAKRETNFLKRTFYKRESKRLREHEGSLVSETLLCISKSDQEYYLEKGANSFYAPVPLFFDRNIEPESSETYALFHGNLSVQENVEAVQVLIEQHYNSPIQIRVKVAGKNPGPELMRQLEDANISCIANPSEEEMNKLIYGATVHLCIGFQVSGLKLKLLRSLETGENCIATEEMLVGTGLHEFCTIWNPKEESLADLIEKMPVLSTSEVVARKEKLKQLVAPENYVRLIEETLFN